MKNKTYNISTINGESFYISFAEMKKQAKKITGKSRITNNARELANIITDGLCSGIAVYN